MNTKNYETILERLGDGNVTSYFKRAIAKYESRQQHYQEVIELAARRGAMRETLRHDIIIHPEFPFMGNISERSFPTEVIDQIGQEYENYHSKIKQIIGTNRSAIIFLFGGENVISEDPARKHFSFNYEDHLVLTSDYNQAPGLVSGRVAGPDLATFLDGIHGLNPKDEFRLHGSDLSDCVSDFAIQLYALLHLNQFQPAWKKQGTRILQASVRDVINKLGLIKDTHIRAGTVFDDRNTWLYCLKQAPTAIPMQLLDEHSLVIPVQSDTV